MQCRLLKTQMTCQAERGERGNSTSAPQYPFVILEEEEQRSQHQILEPKQWELGVDSLRRSHLPQREWSLFVSYCGMWKQIDEGRVIPLGPDEAAGRAASPNRHQWELPLLLSRRVTWHSQTLQPEGIKKGKFCAINNHSILKINVYHWCLKADWIVIYTTGCSSAWLCVLAWMMTLNPLSRCVCIDGLYCQFRSSLAFGVGGSLREVGGVRGWWTGQMLYEKSPGESVPWPREGVGAEEADLWHNQHNTQQWFPWQLAASLSRLFSGT